MKKYYAIHDDFLGLNPREFGHGFANMKRVIAFRSRADRDRFVASTRDLTASAVRARRRLAFTEAPIIEWDAETKKWFVAWDPGARAWYTAEGSVREVEDA